MDSQNFGAATSGVFSGLNPNSTYKMEYSLIQEVLAGGLYIQFNGDNSFAPGYTYFITGSAPTSGVALDKIRLQSVPNSVGESTIGHFTFATQAVGPANPVVNGQGTFRNGIESSTVAARYHLVGGITSVEVYIDGGTFSGRMRLLELV